MTARLAACSLVVAAACTGGSAGSDDGSREFLIREGEEFVVPSGRVAVVTRLWADSPTIDEVALGADGQELLSVTPHRGADETTVLVTACAGARLAVHGGMTELDARCSGYLVRADKLALGCR